MLKKPKQTKNKTKPKKNHPPHKKQPQKKPWFFKIVTISQVWNHVELTLQYQCSVFVLLLSHPNVLVEILMMVASPGNTVSPAKGGELLVGGIKFIFSMI